jgi:histidyl-tRNA synthetase
MSKINAPRGTADILPAESWKWQAVEAIARQVSVIYHYSEIRTPIFESTELFHRGVGETSDVVHKETYTFNDRGDRSITLRPEGTAGTVRAAIEHSLIAQEGSRAKVYYIGPNFRYERPASGRLRQHHQFGVEAFGVAEPEQDVECILLQLDFYQRCGLKLEDLRIRINSLGDRESKQRLAEHIRETLTPVKERLSEDSRRRLTENPLRILDSKEPSDQFLINEVKLFTTGFLSTKSEEYRARVHSLLNEAPLIKDNGAAAFFDSKLVRGFDYYTETLWEIALPALGPQDALGGGGRYDNLVENLGGRPTPGVGFGSGIERLLLALDSQKIPLPDPRQPLVWIAFHGEHAKSAAWKLLADLRAAGIAADMDLSNRSMKAQFKQADRESAKWCLILGDEELKSNTVTAKNLTTGEQSAIAREEITAKMSAIFSPLPI